MSRRRRDERGAVAIIFAMVVVMLFAVAAIGVDITSQVLKRQTLHDTLDLAAHAGAYALPGDGAGARAAALAMAKANDPAANPTIDLWCVVASNGAPLTVKASQIPSTCNPGTRAVHRRALPRPALRHAALRDPVHPGGGRHLQHGAGLGLEQLVPYAFAPAIGKSEGSTGYMTSTACKGSCGAEAPNPLDIVVVADRTPSMSDTDRDGMVTAIESMLKTMDPTQHYVALETIHKSKNNSNTCVTDDTQSNEGANGGRWIPVDFSNNYLTTGDQPDAQHLQHYGPGAGLPAGLEPRWLRHPPRRGAQGCGPVPARDGQQQPVLAPRRGRGPRRR